MTKLKDLQKERLKIAKKKKGVELVENTQCGCLVDAKERYWTVKLPIMPIQQQGQPATLVVTIMQCNGCKRIIDGRGEMMIQKPPLIELAR